MSLIGMAIVLLKREKHADKKAKRKILRDHSNFLDISDSAGKHKNKTQNEILLDFMEKYPDIARGFTRRDKPLVDSLWQQLKESLNSAGPPHKDINGWKKIWTDWKSEVKKKLALNKMESRATGGGPFTKYVLTQTEETIVRICGITQSVQGVSGVSLGPCEDIEQHLREGVEIEILEEFPSTSSRVESFEACGIPKRRRTESLASNLKNFLDEDTETKNELNKKIDEIIKTQKENVSNSKRTYRAIEKGTESVAKAIIDLKKEFVSFSNCVLRAMQEKNEIKKQQLDLDLLKFDLQQKNKSTSK